MTAHKKPGIPSVTGIDDKATSSVVSALKQNVETMTGARSGLGPLSFLTGTAIDLTTAQAVNNIISRLNAGGDVPPTLTQASAASSSGVPAGVIFDYAGNTLPTGYLLCDGSNVSRTTYSTLFAAVGTLWGVGDGTTTFGLPDTRRRVGVGSGGTGTGTLGNAVGNTGGQEAHVLTIAEIPSHTHSYFTASGPGAIYAGGASYDQPQVASGATGGDGAHNNIQPSYVVKKMIKT